MTAAAQAKVPDATVDRVETDSDGSAYEAHMTKADGTRVTVKVDENFTATAVETGGPGGGHKSGPGRGGRGGESDLTGTTASSVTTAALAAVPGATVDRVESNGSQPGYHAHLTKADDTRVTVRLDENFTVTDVQTGGNGGKRGRPLTDTVTSGS